MSYTIGSVAKALFAGFATFSATAVAAAHGADLSVLSAGDWLTVIGGTLVSAGGTFKVTNSPTEPEKSPSEVVTSAVTQAAAAKDAANAEFDSVVKVLSDAAGAVPVFGAQAQAVLAGLPKL